MINNIKVKLDTYRYREMVNQLLEVVAKKEYTNQDKLINLKFYLNSSSNFIFDRLPVVVYGLHPKKNRILGWYEIKEQFYNLDDLRGDDFLKLETDSVLASYEDYTIQPFYIPYTDKNPFKNHNVITLVDDSLETYRELIHKLEKNNLNNIYGFTLHNWDLLQNSYQDEEEFNPLEDFNHFELCAVEDKEHTYQLKIFYDPLINEINEGEIIKIIRYGGYFKLDSIRQEAKDEYQRQINCDTIISGQGIYWSKIKPHNEDNLYILPEPKEDSLDKAKKQANEVSDLENYYLILDVNQTSWFRDHVLNLAVTSLKQDWFRERLNKLFNIPYDVLARPEISDLLYQPEYLTNWLWLSRRFIKFLKQELDFISNDYYDNDYYDGYFQRTTSYNNYIDDTNCFIFDIKHTEITIDNLPFLDPDKINKTTTWPEEFNKLISFIRPEFFDVDNYLKSNPMVNGLQEFLALDKIFNSPDTLYCYLNHIHTYLLGKYEFTGEKQYQEKAIMFSTEILEGIDFIPLTERLNQQKYFFDDTEETEIFFGPKNDINSKEDFINANQESYNNMLSNLGEKQYFDAAKEIYKSLGEKGFFETYDDVEKQGLLDTELDYTKIKDGVVFGCDKAIAEAGLEELVLNNMEWDALSKVIFPPTKKTRYSYFPSGDMVDSFFRQYQPSNSQELNSIQELANFLGEDVNKPSFNSYKPDDILNLSDEDIEKLLVDSNNCLVELPLTLEDLESNIKVLALDEKIKRPFTVDDLSKMELNLLTIYTLLDKHDYEEEHTLIRGLISGSYRVEPVYLYTKKESSRGVLEESKELVYYEILSNLDLELVKTQPLDLILDFNLSRFVNFIADIYKYNDYNYATVNHDGEINYHYNQGMGPLILDGYEDVNKHYYNQFSLDDKKYNYQKKK